MKLQSRLIQPGRITNRGAQPSAVADPVEAPLSTNLQSLAAELQQAAVQGVFAYPRDFVVVAKTLSALLVMLAIGHVTLTAIPLLRAGGNSPMALLSWQMLGAAVGSVAVGIVAAFLANLLPTIHVTPQGLGISELTGKRRIPWDNIGVLRVMEMRNSTRYVVMIPIKGRTSPRTPAPMLRWIPQLAGAVDPANKVEKGLLITSDMKNFERLLQLIVSYMMQNSGQNSSNAVVETYVEENVVMPFAQIVLDPAAALDRLARTSESKVDLYGTLTDTDSDPPLVWSRVMLRQFFIALVPAMVLLADVLGRHGERPFVPAHAVFAALIVGLGLVELPFVAKLVQVVGELMVGSGRFSRATNAYLELQMPRAVLVVVGAALLGAGAPALLTQALWFAGIVLTTLFLTRFTQRLYYIPLTHTLLAAIGAFIFQLSLLALYVGVR
jgi:hypothetical protein